MSSRRTSRERSALCPTRGVSRVHAFVSHVASPAHAVFRSAPAASARRATSAATSRFISSLRRLVEGLQLGRVPRDGRDPVGHVEERRGELVPRGLVAGQGLVRALRHRPREELRVAERVADAVGGDRVLEVGGVAHEGPALSPRAAEVPRVAGEAVEGSREPCPPEPLRELGRGLREDAPVAPGDVRPHLVGEPLRGHSREDQDLAAVRGDGAGRGRRAPVPVVAVHVEARPVPVDAGGGVPALARHGRPHQGGHRRAQAVGADHDPGAHGPFAAVRVLRGRRPPPARRRRGARSASRTRWRTSAPASTAASTRTRSRTVRRGAKSAGDAVPGLDGDVDHLVLVVEHRPPDAGRALSLDPLEQPPGGELEDPRPHQGVGREGVGAVGPAVHGEDAEPPPGQEHRGGRARGTRADDDHVVPGFHPIQSVHDRSPSRSHAARRRCAARWVVRSMASRPTPSMKLDLRRRRK